MATVTPIVNPQEEADYAVTPTQLRPPADQGTDGGADGGGGAGGATPPVDPWSSALEGMGPDASYVTPGQALGNQQEEQRQFEQGKLDAQRDALIDIEALDSEYQQILQSLRGQYQTSQTAQEKERLRFILSDIAAQYEAGVEAISSLYAETTQRLNNMSSDYRSGIEGRAAEVESAFTTLAQQATDRNLARRQGLADEYRGYGVGVGYDPRDANTDFLASLAPIQGNYSRMMGESAAGGIDFIAGMAEMQGLAQQGDLKRLAAATRTAAIQSHEQQVSARIQAERAAARGDRMNLEMAALSSRQSAMDLNARLMNQAIQAQQYVPGDTGERYTNMLQMVTSAGTNLQSPDIFARLFNNQFNGAPPPEFREMYIASYQSAALSEISALQNNIQKLELVPTDPSRLQMEARKNELIQQLRVFGFAVPPTEPSTSGS